MRELRREMWGSCRIPCLWREVLEERRRKEEGKRGKRETVFHIPCRVKDRAIYTTKWVQSKKKHDM